MRAGGGDGWRREESRSLEEGSSYASHPEVLDMRDATSARADLSLFTGLGLHAVGQRLEAGRRVIACRVETDDE